MTWFEGSREHQWSCLREGIKRAESKRKHKDSRLCVQSQAAPIHRRPSSAPTRNSNTRCPTLTEARLSRLQQLQEQALRDVSNAKARRLISAPSTPVRHAAFSKPGAPWLATPRDSRAATATGSDESDKEARPNSQVPSSRTSDSRGKSPHEQPPSSDVRNNVHDHQPANPCIIAERPKTAPPLSEPLADKHGQHVPDALESLFGVPALQSEAHSSAPDKECMPKKPEIKSTQIRRHFGPKALQAAAAAARAAAHFHVTTSQAKKIGQDMKRTHFDLTDMSRDAITRASTMESTYRRLFIWGEGHSRLNPTTNFTIANLPTASV